MLEVAAVVVEGMMMCLDVEFGSVLRVVAVAVEVKWRWCKIPKKTTKM